MARLYDATWGRFFSAAYDRLLRGTEEAGLREIRRECLASATGRTIDIGAGTGANLSLFPSAVSELVLAEPDPHMLSRLRARLDTAPPGTEVVQAGAEALPFEDASFDTAVFTLVLCTVPNPSAALAEAARVLKPGGRLLFVEHVRAEDPGLARWQDRLERPWHFLGDGCHCNRDTARAIEAGPFEQLRIEHGEMPKAPPIVRPLMHGAAVRSGAA
ncbi:MAG TPA: class I SAM-dependent methyltransferase [Solirubrobacterales bacterium]|nr:class I SAM-dependent methyltransferase [Solirubrobacterales bacterium]